MDQYDRERAGQDLLVWEAVLSGVDRRHEVLDAIWDAPSEDQARARVQALLDLDEVSAEAVLSLQVRRMTAESRQVIVDRLAEIRELMDRDD